MVGRLAASSSPSFFASSSSCCLSSSFSPVSPFLCVLAFSFSRADGRGSRAGGGNPPLSGICGGFSRGRDDDDQRTVPVSRNLRLDSSRALLSSALPLALPDPTATTHFRSSPSGLHVVFLRSNRYRVRALRFGSAFAEVRQCPCLSSAISAMENLANFERWCKSLQSGDDDTEAAQFTSLAARQLSSMAGSLQDYSGLAGCMQDVLDSYKNSHQGKPIADLLDVLLKQNTQLKAELIYFPISTPGYEKCKQWAQDRNIYSPTIDRDTTIMVVTPGALLEASDILEAILARVSVVNINWFHKSYTENKPAITAFYRHSLGYLDARSKEPTNFVAARERLSGLPALFEGCTFYFHNETRTEAAVYWKYFIELGGGNFQILGPNEEDGLLKNTGFLPARPTPDATYPYFNTFSVYREKTDSRWGKCGYKIPNSNVFVIDFNDIVQMVLKYQVEAAVTLEHRSVMHQPSEEEIKQIELRGGLAVPMSDVTDEFEDLNLEECAKEQLAMSEMEEDGQRPPTPVPTPPATKADPSA